MFFNDGEDEQVGHHLANTANGQVDITELTSLGDLSATIGDLSATLMEISSNVPHSSRLTYHW